MFRRESLSFLQEARLPTIPWGSVGDQLKEEMNPSTTYWRTRTSLDLQEDLSLLPGEARVDRHRRLTPSVARPLVGSPHSKLHPSQSVSTFT
jgi:hypothetical protein